MKRIIKGRALCLKLTVFTLFLSLLALGSATAETLKMSDYYSEIKPDRVHSKSAREIVEQLKYNHYTHKKLNDMLSDKVFERYLKDLDHMKGYLLASDVASFEKYRYRMDDSLKKGDLKPAYTIYNVYQKRMIERTLYMLNRVNKGFPGINVEKDDFLETDREELKWVKNSAGLKELWRKMLKNEYLKLVLTEKTGDDIKDLLVKRFNDQLNRIQQLNADDVFQLYMNSVAQVYGPHTQYFSPHNYENFDISMKLSLEGIGAQLRYEEGYTKVVSLIAAGPAEKSKKIKAGDLIVGVGEGMKGSIVDVIGWRIDEVVKLIRGPKGTIVRLEIVPSKSATRQDTEVIVIKRDKVKLEEQSAKHEIKTIRRNGKAYNIGVIDIPTFYMDFDAFRQGDPDYKSTSGDVRRILADFKKKKVDGVIVDLRNNGGGSLIEANALTGLFIKKGPVVQVRDDRGYVSRYKDPSSDIAYAGPLLVLVNRMSASASEIFSGAIQDYGRGIIAGSRTFGKGTVQTIVPLVHGQLKITRAKFYRVSGESTQNRGIVPDIIFPDMVDEEEIGESSLPEALSWDTIMPAQFSRFGTLESSINKINRRHNVRVNDNPDFTFIREAIDYIQEKSGETKLSLKKSARKQQRDEYDERKLQAENKRRKAKGLKPIDNLDGIEDDDSDTFLLESEYVIMDLIDLAIR